MSDKQQKSDNLFKQTGITPTRFLLSRQSLSEPVSARLRNRVENDMSRISRTSNSLPLQIRKKQKDKNDDHDDEDMPEIPDEPSTISISDTF